MLTQCSAAAWAPSAPLWCSAQLAWPTINALILLLLLQALQGRRASQFLDLVEPVASRLPYMVLPGNHEWHFNFSHYRQGAGCWLAG